MLTELADVHQYGAQMSVHIAGNCRIATWNLEWRAPTSEATAVILQRLSEVGADAAVLTEVRLSTLEHWPSVEHAGVGLYRGTPADGAKVAVVSRLPMRVVNVGGTSDLPVGNLLAVDVETVDGPLRVIGVVVRWKQISAYIDVLPTVLERTVVPGRTVLAGDFNLRLPGGDQSKRLEQVLLEAGLTVRTTGAHPALADERPLIDHIAVSQELETTDLEVWPRRDQRYRNGTAELTDHAGAAVTVVLNS